MAQRRTMGAVILDESMSAAKASSPLRRRSMASAATPIPNSMRELIQNDDEREIMARRRQQPPTDTSVSADNTERRVSLGLVGGLTTNEIMEHYSKCVKMCAENKINSKNVFALSMIDYMAVLNKRDTSSNNMQTAGTSLDVCAKIYGLRVDCVYTDVYKMAGDPSKQDKANKETGADEDNGNSSRVEEPEMKKKRARRAQKILCPVESLSSKPEHLILRSTSNNSDSQTSDMMLQTIYPVHANSRHGLHLHEDVVLDFPPEKKDAEAKNHADNEVPALEDLQDSNICPMFADFYILRWSEADVPESPPRGNSPAHENFRFDLDASIVEPCGNDNEGMNYFDLDDASQENIDRCGRMGRDQVEQIVDFSESVAVRDQQKSLEYSYLQKSSVNLHWAGPVHWKPRALSKIPNGSKVVGACRQESGRKKKELILKYNNETIDAIMDKLQSKLQKKLQTKTVRQAWQEEKITLPEDIHYDSANPTKFYYHSSRRMLLAQDTGPEAESNGDNNATLLEDGADYNYNNLNDTLDYCSPNDVPGDNNDDIFENNDQNPDENQNPDQGLCTQGLTGENLVAAPKSTTQLQIQYSTRAKKIDMRQLKKSLWKTLTAQNTVEEQSEEDERDCRASRDVKMKNEREFSGVYKKLPGILGKDNSEALSLPLAFASLLHLANEQNLNIVPTPDMSDLKISQG